MKKEYLILIVLILCVSAYLFLHKDNKDNYTLPEIKKIDTTQVTALILEKKDGVIKFTRKDKQWFLTDKEFPADSALVESMLDALKTLKLSALVSEKQDLRRYELDDDTHIIVKALKNNDLLFELTVGKTAPTMNHSFVMLRNDKNVYHAGGNLKSHFNRTVEDFRDKKILEFKDASVKKLTIEKDNITKTLISKEEKKENEKPASVWSLEDGTPADQQAASSLISTLAFLKCQKYLDSPAKSDLEKNRPVCKIILETESRLELTLYKADKEDTLFGISSMNNYSFELSRFSGKEIVSKTETLLGIKKEEEKKK